MRRGRRQTSCWAKSGTHKYITRYVNKMAKSTSNKCAKFAVIPDLHAIKYPQGVCRVNNSGAKMSAEAVFEVKACSASMTTHSRGDRPVAPSGRRGARIITKYRTKLKIFDKNCTKCK